MFRILYLILTLGMFFYICCADCKLRFSLPLYMFMLESRKYKSFGMVIILNTSDQKATERLLTGLRFRHIILFK